MTTVKPQYRIANELVEERGGVSVAALGSFPGVRQVAGDEFATGPRSCSERGYLLSGIVSEGAWI
jgi:hypothetical protein